MYDLTFILDDIDKDERRMSLAEGTKREVIKTTMEYVQRRKLLALPEKKLLLTVNTNRISKLNDSGKKKLIGQKTRNLMDAVFKKGLEFKPKYVDKTTKNYETWESYQKEEGFFYDPNKEKVVERGDFVTTVPRAQCKSRRTYKRPTEDYKLKNFTIEKIDASKALKVVGKSYFYDEVDKEFYDGSGIVSGDSLLNKTRVKLFEFTGNSKIRTSDSFFRAQLEKKNVIKNTRDDPNREKRWVKFLKYFMIKDVLKREKDINDVKTIQDWVNITHRAKVFEFLESNSFLRKPLREQLYIVRTITGKNNSQSTLGRFLSNRGETVRNIAKQEELKESLTSVSSLPFVRGNIPKVDVYVRFYIEGESDFGQRFGFGAKCEQAVDELKSALNSVIGITSKKAKRKTRKLKNRAPDFEVSKVRIVGGGKTRRRRKRRRKTTRRLY